MRGWERCIIKQSWWLGWSLAQAGGQRSPGNYFCLRGQFGSHPEMIARTWVGRGLAQPLEELLLMEIYRVTGTFQYAAFWRVWEHPPKNNLPHQYFGLFYKTNKSLSLGIFFFFACMLGFYCDIFQNKGHLEIFIMHVQYIYRLVLTASYATYNILSSNLICHVSFHDIKN